MTDTQATERPMPTIGKWRAPEALRENWQILSTQHYQDTGVEKWRTIAHVLQFYAPIPLTHLRCTDDWSVGIPRGQGHELFTRTPAEAARAAKDGD